jgi:hypothetical protein
MPSIAQAYQGASASVRQSAVEIEVQATPRTAVSVVIPPAFPVDPFELFAQADDQMRVTPAEPIMPREIIPDPIEAELESTEAYVARSFQAREGDWSGAERKVE